MKKLKFYHWLIIAFVGMVVVGFGIGYVTDQTRDKSVQGTQIQVSPSETISPSPAQTPEPQPTEEPTQQTTAKPKPVYQPTAETAPEQSAPTPIVQDTPVVDTGPVCNEGRKAELLAKYMSDLQKITMEKNEKWEQSSTNYLNNLPILGQDLATKIMNDERSMANMEYDGDKAYLDAMYNLDLKSISCSN